MTTLEKVSEYKKQGMSEAEITTKLQDEGISPMEIKDAINQAGIKEAVTAPQSQEKSQETMMPSMMEEKTQQNYAPVPEQDLSQTEYTPTQQQSFNQQSAYSMQQPQEEYYEEQYPQEEYTDVYQSSSDTMIEISEQVFSEKIKKIEKQMKEISEFKTIYKTKIDDINDRLKRIEVQFDKMQLSILEKVGEYGKNLNSIQKEMNMIEDSFSKVMKNK